MSRLFTRALIAAAAVALLGGGIAAFILLRPQAPAPEAPAPKPAEQHEIIGTSVEGRSIDAYTYGTGSTTLLFVGGIHGGYEWNSVLLAYQMMDYLKAHPEQIPAGERVLVVPNANPDGVYKIVGKEGRFALADVPAGTDQSAGRFNANQVDLNRNFDCKWQPESTWRSQTVSAGTSPFSEPEAKAIRSLVEKTRPAAAVFWHSQSGTVYASQCENGILPKTTALMNAYANASGYKTQAQFDAYVTSGAADDWLASIGIPAITAELTTHTDVEFNKNLAGVLAVLSLYAR